MADETLAFAWPLPDLAREGRAQEPAASVDAGVPVDLSDGKGDTLLPLAAYAPSPSTVRALLERGADPDEVDERGRTAVAAAASRSSAEAVEALLAAAPTRGGAPGRRRVGAVPRVARHGRAAHPQ